MSNPTGPVGLRLISFNGEDFLQLFNWGTGQVVGWVDANGNAQGSLATSEAGITFASGENVSFSGTSGTLANIPTSNFLIFAKNGVIQQLNSDFTISGANITLTVAAMTEDTFQAWYIY